MNKIHVYLLSASLLCTAVPTKSLAQGRGVDLDQISQDQLNGALYAELDDIYFGRNRNGLYDLDDLFDLIMEALSDNGDYDRNESEDDDDQGEQTITSYNLSAEMEEAGYSLEDVVWNALQTSDQYSNNSSPGIVQVQNRPDRRARLSYAVPAVINNVSNTVRRAR